jgi:UDP-2,3-diacylglucosamine pyrophosphatase LpxH
MSDGKRLTQIFESAMRISFSNSDRLVFFSDVHRGDNSWADEFAHNEMIYTYALQYYYDRGFTYIEVGDGDELLKFKYVEPIRIAHDQVYRLLQKFNQKKRLYYIFGNHDIEYRNPDLVHKKLNKFYNHASEETELLFDDFHAYEGLVFKHDKSGVEIFAVHGHQADDLFHRSVWLNLVMLRYIWRPLQMLGLQDPTSIAQNMYKRQKVEEELIRWSLSHAQPTITGHTHKEHFPKKGKPPYFNTGSCVHPRWITCIEIIGGGIALIRWRIKPNKKGQLIIKRSVQKGPKSIEGFSSRFRLLNNHYEVTASGDKLLAE